ncbi:ACT domain-containing protein [Actinoplanes xinjiangensis]|uniref:ACT domain-containing protein n=1 Tax=Actinoplanes xinjiangensis TaxID=512350 RepID=UPI0034282178
MSFPRRHLRILPSRFVIDHHSERSSPLDDSWFAAVRGPEGLTVIRTIDDGRPDSAAEHWLGLYGDDPHDLDLPGMLAAVVAPLGAAAIPVFVASTFHSDLVLVPENRLDEALGVLDAAGHTVDASS